MCFVVVEKKNRKQKLAQLIIVIAYTGVVAPSPLERNAVGGRRGCGHIQAIEDGRHRRMVEPVVHFSVTILISWLPL